MKNRARVVSALAVLSGIQACNALVGVDDVSLRGNDSGAAAGENVGGSAPQGGSGPGEGPLPEGGGAPGASGAPTVGVSGAPSGGGGAGGEGGASGGGGASGEGGGGNTAGETSACPILGEDRGGGKLTLLQAPLLEGARGRLVITQDGKNAYNTTWGLVTQHFARDTKTGKLTPKSTASVYNGEMAVLSPDDKRLFVAGTNGKQFYDIPIAADGTIADTPTSNPADYELALDGVRVGETIFLASGSSIRTISNGAYDATNRALPGTYQDAINLTRIGDYLYWTESTRSELDPHALPYPPKVGRMRVSCDGTSGPREAFATAKSPFQVAGCNKKPRYLYVNHFKVKDVLGSVDIVDLDTCDSDFERCVPVKTLTGSDVTGFDDPRNIHMSPDCTTLYVTIAGSNPVDSAFMVLDLKDPLRPKPVQTFEAGGTYDGVTLTGDLRAWNITWFDGYVYVPFSYGQSVGVFKAER